MKLTDGQRGILTLINAQGIGQVKGRKLLDNLKNFATIVTNPDSIRSEIVALTGEKDFVEIKSSLEKMDFDKIETKLNNLGIRLVTMTDPEYPESLLPYGDMPLALYCKGDISLLNIPSFAVIGTRYPTRYGLRATDEFVAKLCERFCIVSGMARGVDAAAHRAALENGGKTIAVLGSGVDVVYPAENYSVYRDIAERGLVVSEYEPGTQASAHHFPARNRIISGLSRGVLVTEAGLKSGTMLTIRYAVNQGKDIYCVPGSIYSAASGGCNRSIKECQSRAVIDVNDIYDELGLSLADLTKPSAIQLDFNENNVLRLLEKGGDVHYEDIADTVDLTVPQLNSLLVKMEAAGLITKTKHNYWSV